MDRGLKPGQTLCEGKYRIEKVLGQGTFGITYLATARFTVDGDLGKMQVEGKVAIKEFFMEEVNSRDSDGRTINGSSSPVFSNYRRKFEREAKNLSKLKHPNIVRVYSVFDENNTTYYSMEFIEGCNLDEYIQKGPMPEEEALEMMNEIGAAVSHMHSKRMLHLDIKPKNIMRTSKGKYYLIDFGLSKQFNDEGQPEATTSIGLGTPRYAPPEQSGYQPDGTFPATLDVYAMGATMFKALTATLPPKATSIFSDGFPTEQLSEHDISPRTINAVEKAMQPASRRRYRTVSALLRGLDPNEIVVLDVRTGVNGANGGGNHDGRHGGNHGGRHGGNHGGRHGGSAKGKSGADSGSGIKQLWEKYRWQMAAAPAVLALAGVLLWFGMMAGKINGHDYVDLGLPSGLKWAAYNIGASSPSEFGCAYAWGETATKSSYDAQNSLTIDKNRKVLLSRGIIDESGNLAPAYDAASSDWGASWRTPGKDDLEELIEHCTWRWTSLDGHNGYEVTGPNGKSIFLPATGYCQDAEVKYSNAGGYYWSDTPPDVATGDEATKAYCLDFDKQETGIYSHSRINGFHIRPVSE